MGKWKIDNKSSINFPLKLPMLWLDYGLKMCVVMSEFQRLLHNGKMKRYKWVDFAF